MYPNNPPPPPGHQTPEYDQYPMQDTHFAPPQHVDRGDPFADPYPDHAAAPGAYDNQPLLRGSPAPYPRNDEYFSPGAGAGAPPSPQPEFPAFTPPSPNMHYGGAPRRQPRRYKTSKLAKT